MSRNLVELIKRHHGVDAPSALAVLKAAVDDHGEVTDDDRRHAAELSGVPEAAVYGISTFYDDLLVPRGERHVRVCTGTACFAATGGAHVDAVAEGFGLTLGERSADGRLSLAHTVCLGFCHSSPAVRDGDLVDAGPNAAARAIAATCVEAVEPEWVSLLEEPVLTRPGDWSGLRRALGELGPERLLSEVEAATVRGRGGAGFPAGTKWKFTRAAKGEEKFIVANGDEGDPGSYIDKYLMEQNPALVLEGLALAGFAVGAGHGFVLTRSEYPRSKPALEAAAEEARAEGLLGSDILGSGFDFDITIVEGAGSYVVGEETALLACLQGLRGTVSARPPFPAERGVFGCPTVVNNTETLANMPFIACHGAQAYADLSPDSESNGSKLICFNERFARPTVYEVPFGMSMRALCEEVAGGLRDGRSIKAVQIGGPLGGILPASRLDTAFDFDALAAEGCMVGHGSICAFDDHTDIRALTVHLLEFGADESCGKCFPCRIGLRRAHDMFAAEGGRALVSRERFEQLLETLELGSLCAHGSGMPAPLRSLLAHFSNELGARVISVAVDGATVEVPEGATILTAAKQAGRWVPTLCFDERQAPFGACRVCLVAVEGAPKPLPACTTPCRDGMVISTEDPTARRVATSVVELVLSELPVAPAAHTELAQVAGRLGVTGEPRWPGVVHQEEHDYRHPYLAFQHELCISCGRCVRACDEVQGAFALTAVGRGFTANVTAGLAAGFEDSTCVSCGACSDSCPTDAITEITLLDGLEPRPIPERRRGRRRNHRDRANMERAPGSGDPPRAPKELDL